MEPWTSPSMIVCIMRVSSGYRAVAACQSPFFH
jgi:hypothetical protein